MNVLGDWGSTRLRLWLFNDGEIVARRDGPGIIGLGTPPADVLRNLVADWPAVPITLCGMAGARGGLAEAGYVECPLSVDDWRGCATDLTLGGVRLRIGAGCVCSGPGGLDDVMRGEETQIFGACARDPALASGEHWLVLPGTHSKWVRLADGRIAEFRTFFTGELFAGLQQSSLLGGAADQSSPDGFAAGLARAREGSGLLGSLFAARSGQLRGGQDAAWAHGYLSGLLIGSEMAEMRTASRLPRRVKTIGDGNLAVLYAQALASFDVASTALDGEACVIEGLRMLEGLGMLDADA